MEDQDTQSGGMGSSRSVPTLGRPSYPFDLEGNICLQTEAPSKGRCRWYRRCHPHQNDLVSRRHGIAEAAKGQEGRGGRPMGQSIKLCSLKER